MGRPDWHLTYKPKWRRGHCFVRRGRSYESLCGRHRLKKSGGPLPSSLHRMRSRGDEARPRGRVAPRVTGLEGLHLIIKTQRVFKRRVRTYSRLDIAGYGVHHNETVQRDTWWLLGTIPIYSEESILTTNI
jgi:hypothetical protein